MDIFRSLKTLLARKKRGHHADERYFQERLRFCLENKLLDFDVLTGLRSVVFTVDFDTSLVVRSNAAELRDSFEMDSASDRPGPDSAPSNRPTPKRIWPATICLAIFVI
jgi:hypothetical protein